jgi:hypothetical protein
MLQVSVLSCANVCEHVLSDMLHAYQRPAESIGTSFAQPPFLRELYSLSLPFLRPRNPACLGWPTDPGKRSSNPHHPDSPRAWRLHE